MSYFYLLIALLFWLPNVWGAELKFELRFPPEYKTGPGQQVVFEIPLDVEIVVPPRLAKSIVVYWPTGFRELVNIRSFSNAQIADAKTYLGELGAKEPMKSGLVPNARARGLNSVCVHYSADRPDSPLLEVPPEIKPIMGTSAVTISDVRAYSKNQTDRVRNFLTEWGVPEDLMDSWPWSKGLSRGTKPTPLILQELSGGRIVVVPPSVMLADGALAITLPDTSLLTEAQSSELLIYLEAIRVPRELRSPKVRTTIELAEGKFLVVPPQVQLYGGFGWILPPEKDIRKLKAEELTALNAYLVGHRFEPFSTTDPVPEEVTPPASSIPAPAPPSKAPSFVNGVPIKCVQLLYLFQFAQEHKRKVVAEGDPLGSMVITGYAAP